MSFRSLPSSAKRTVTRPPGSIRTTTPSPRVEWRGGGAGGAGGRGGAGGVAGGETRHVVARRDLALPRRAVARPRRRAEALALDVAVGQLVEEARRQVVVATAVQHPRARVQQGEALLR